MDYATAGLLDLSGVFSYSNVNDVSNSFDPRERSARMSSGNGATTQVGYDYMGENYQRAPVTATDALMLQEFLAFVDSELSHSGNSSFAAESMFDLSRTKEASISEADYDMLGIDGSALPPSRAPRLRPDASHPAEVAGLTNSFRTGEHRSTDGASASTVPLSNSRSNGAVPALKVAAKSPARPLQADPSQPFSTLREYDYSVGGSVPRKNRRASITQPGKPPGDQGFAFGIDAYLHGEELGFGRQPSFERVDPELDRTANYLHYLGIITDDLSPAPTPATMPRPAAPAPWRASVANRGSDAGNEALKRWMELYQEGVAPSATDHRVSKAGAEPTPRTAARQRSPLPDLQLANLNDASQTEASTAAINEAFKREIALLMKSILPDADLAEPVANSVNSRATGPILASAKGGCSAFPRTPKSRVAPASTAQRLCTTTREPVKQTTARSLATPLTPPTPTRTPVAAAARAGQPPSAVVATAVSSPGTSTATSGGKRRQTWDTAIPASEHAHRPKAASPSTTVTTISTVTTVRVTPTPTPAAPHQHQQQQASNPPSASKGERNHSSTSIGNPYQYWDDGWLQAAEGAQGTSKQPAGGAAPTSTRGPADVTTRRRVFGASGQQTPAFVPDLPPATRAAPRQTAPGGLPTVPSIRHGSGAGGAPAAAPRPTNLAPLPSVAGPDNQTPVSTKGGHGPVLPAGVPTSGVSGRRAMSQQSPPGAAGGSRTATPRIGASSPTVKRPTGVDETDAHIDYLLTSIEQQPAPRQQQQQRTSEAARNSAQAGRVRLPAAFGSAERNQPASADPIAASLDSMVKMTAGRGRQRGDTVTASVATDDSNDVVTELSQPASPAHGRRRLSEFRTGGYWYPSFKSKASLPESAAAAQGEGQQQLEREAHKANEERKARIQAFMAQRKAEKETARLDSELSASPALRRRLPPATAPGGSPYTGSAQSTASLNVSRVPPRGAGRKVMSTPVAPFLPPDAASGHRLEESIKCKVAADAEAMVKTVVVGLTAAPRPARPHSHLTVAKDGCTLELRATASDPARTFRVDEYLVATAGEKQDLTRSSATMIALNRAVVSGTNGALLLAGGHGAESTTLEAQRRVLESLFEQLQPTWEIFVSMALVSNNFSWDLLLVETLPAGASLHRKPCNYRAMPLMGMVLDGASFVKLNSAAQGCRLMDLGYGYATKSARESDDIKDGMIVMNLVLKQLTADNDVVLSSLLVGNPLASADSYDRILARTQGMPYPIFHGALGGPTFTVALFAVDPTDVKGTVRMLNTQCKLGRVANRQTHLGSVRRFVHLLGKEVKRQESTAAAGTPKNKKLKEQLVLGRAVLADPEHYWPGDTPQEAARKLSVNRPPSAIGHTSPRKLPHPISTAEGGKGRGLSASASALTPKAGGSSSLDSAAVAEKTGHLRRAGDANKNVSTPRPAVRTPRIDQLLPVPRPGSASLLQTSAHSLPGDARYPGTDAAGGKATPSSATGAGQQFMKLDDDGSDDGGGGRSPAAGGRRQPYATTQAPKPLTSAPPVQPGRVLPGGAAIGVNGPSWPSEPSLQQQPPAPPMRPDPNGSRPISRSTSVGTPTDRDGLTPQYMIPPSTKVRTLVLVDPKCGETSNVTYDNTLVIATTEDDFEEYDVDEVAEVPPGSDFIASDVLQELCSTVLMGCNAAILAADSRSYSVSTLVLKSVVRTILKTIADGGGSRRGSLTASIVKLKGETVVDLLSPGASDPQKLVIAISPIFGSCVHGVEHRPVSNEDKFEAMLNGAIARAADGGRDHGLVFASLILKLKVPDQDDVVVCSLVASFAGENVGLYTSVLERSPLVPRALYHYALGGPCYTVALLGIGCDEARANQMLQVQHRLGEISNRPTHPGSIVKFIQGIRHDLQPALTEKLRHAADAEERATTSEILGRLEEMVNDAELLLRDFEHHEPKAYLHEKESGGGSGGGGTASADPQPPQPPAREVVTTRPRPRAESLEREAAVARRPLPQLTLKDDGVFEDDEKLRVKSLVCFDQRLLGGGTAFVEGNSVFVRTGDAGKRFDSDEVIVRDGENVYVPDSKLIDELVRKFASGHNTGLLAADSGNCAFTPLVLRKIVYQVVGAMVPSSEEADGQGGGGGADGATLIKALGGHAIRGELQVSMALVKDNITADLLPVEADAAYHNFEIEHSPIFGPRITGVTSHFVNSAEDFDRFLAIAIDNADPALQTDDPGIMVVSIILTQLMPNDDVCVSALMCTAVFDAVHHYFSVLDRNPLEPLDLFRSILSGAAFSIAMVGISDQDANPVALLNSLGALSRMVNRPTLLGSATRHIRELQEGIAKLAEHAATSSNAEEKKYIRQRMEVAQWMLQDAENLKRQPMMQHQQRQQERSAFVPLGAPQMSALETSPE